MVDVWHLNFDADDELSRAGRRKAPMAARSAALTTQVRELLGPGHRLLGDAEARAPGRGYAWMMTDSARSVLTAAGFAPVASPPMGVLAEANGRRFSAALGVALPGATFVLHEEALAAAIAQGSKTGAWLLVREHAFAGRHRQRLSGAALPQETRAWAEASFRVGEGIEVVPWMNRVADFGLHGYVAEGGATTLGEPTEQRCDARGQWQSTARTNALSGSEHAALAEAAEETARALHGIGYFGPFGIDAFRYESDDGALGFCPRCEVNARYSMGWAIGMGERRPDLVR